MRPQRYSRLTTDTALLRAVIVTGSKIWEKATKSWSQSQKDILNSVDKAGTSALLKSMFLGAWLANLLKSHGVSSKHFYS
ncbi:hypothetical protein PybrP1_001832 [[Pythium] brassicae (nom. inval.)]|nr:hypothetical protein PybrP1_001832 [[Pythium] brassicae (nom. inval.)]